jgi:hypothetical protein
MPKKPIDLQAVREAEERLKQLMQDHPELRDPERQLALADWLSTSLEEKPTKKTGRPRVPDAERLVSVSLRLAPDLHRRLERYAWQHRRSITALVREGIELRLAQPDPAKPTAKRKKTTG